ncbi:NmrA family NAD(P)-binding protein [Streptomyces flavofungini]|uniref:NmrA family NAD(P)-binding protein n=1 Tax=Streptomyces flavofungini TaxID=68200 RepID=UPI0034DE2E9A
MSPVKPFLVTGGTGTTGSRVRAHLTATGHRTRTATRTPTSTPGTDGEMVRFDWTDPTTHAPALDGVGGVYLVPPVGDPDPAASMLPFLHRARGAGIERVVLLGSSAIAETDGGLGEVYRSIRALFPQWAVLRPSWFMQNFTGGHVHARSIRERGEIVTATGDGRVAFVDADDIAAVAARALTDEHPHNTAHLITGPEALSYADIAATLTRVTGRPIRHRSISRTTMRDRLTTDGLPEPFADLLAAMDEAIATGAEDRTSGAVERVTGRAPRSFAEFVGSADLA